MKYDLSIVINQEIKLKIEKYGKYFNSKRVSTILSKILSVLYPYLNYYHSISKDYIPKYEKINWDKKIHVCIDYKIYLILKKIYEDTNGYSMAYIIRRMIDFFDENIEKYDNIEYFESWINDFCQIRKNNLKKRQFDVWKYMKDNDLNKFGRLIFCGERREFPLDYEYLSIKYNKYFRPIGFYYTQ